MRSGFTSSRLLLTHPEDLVHDYPESPQGGIRGVQVQRGIQVQQGHCLPCSGPPLFSNADPLPVEPHQSLSAPSPPPYCLEYEICHFTLPPLTLGSFTVILTVLISEDVCG